MDIILRKQLIMKMKMGEKMKAVLKGFNGLESNVRMKFKIGMGATDFELIGAVRRKL